MSHASTLKQLVADAVSMSKTAAQVDRALADGKQAPSKTEGKRDTDQEKTAAVAQNLLLSADALEYVANNLSGLVDDRSDQEKLAEAINLVDMLTKAAVEGEAHVDAGNAPSRLEIPKNPGMDASMGGPANEMKTDLTSPPGGNGTQPTPKNGKPMEAGKATEKAGPTDSPTALSTNAAVAPGGNNGSVPTAKYPDTGVLKQAAEDDDQYSVRPGFFRGMQARERATRAGPSGLKRYMLDPDANEKMTLEGLKGMGIGTLGGGAVGAGAGALASALSRGKYRPSMGESAAVGGILGGSLGSMIGGGAGAEKGLRQHLKTKGIKSDLLGFRNRMTPEAKERYIPESYEKRASLLDFMKRAANDTTTSIGAKASLEGTVVDGGTMPGTVVGEGVPKQPTQNEGVLRKLVATSNNAAIDYTPRDTVGPDKKRMAELLDNPMLSAAQDPQLNAALGTDLTNAAGTKLSAASGRALLANILDGEYGANAQVMLKEAAARRFQKVAGQAGIESETGAAKVQGSPSGEDDAAEDEKDKKRKALEKLLQTKAQAKGEERED